MKHKLSTLLDEASALELQVADIYEHFSIQFAENITLSHFWCLFAEAERYHGLIIQMQKLGMTDPTSDTELINTWEKEIQEARDDLTKALNRLKVDGWVPTVGEAFELAQDLESLSLEVQSRSFVLFNSPAIKELVAKLHEEDLKHRSKLVEAQAHFAKATA